MKIVDSLPCKIVKQGRRVSIINIPPFGRKYRISLGENLYMQYITVDARHVHFDGMKNAETGKSSLNYSDETYLVPSII